MADEKKRSGGIPYENYQEELVKLRRHFHKYPELSLEEKETADYVYDYLEQLGLKPERPCEHGVTAVIWAAEEKRSGCGTVAVRAEMDALPVQEQNPVPWRSCRDGVMHACGHDGILAAGLVLAKICVEYRHLLPVNVKMIFQPAEENGQGTGMMLDAGVMEHPAVDKFLMYHYVNDAPLGMELHRGVSTAAIGSVWIRVRGKSAHWSSSGQGIDAICAAAKVVEAASELNRTFLSPWPFVVGIGMIQGGKAKNVVADEAILQGTIRTCDLGEYECLRNEFLDKIKEIEAVTHTQIEAEIDEEPIPPIVNDEGMVDQGLQVGEKVWGTDSRLVTQLYLSGDSAAYYFRYAKGLFLVFTAAKPGEENYPLHYGRFDFHEDILWRSVETIHRFLLESE